MTNGRTFECIAILLRGVIELENRSRLRVRTIHAMCDEEVLGSVDVEELSAKGLKGIDRLAFFVNDDRVLRARG